MSEGESKALAQLLRRDHDRGAIMSGVNEKIRFGNGLARALGAGLRTGMALLLVAGTALALDGRPRNVPASDIQAQELAAPVDTTPGPQAAAPVPAAPAPAAPTPPASATPASGTLESVGRWIDDSVTSAGAGIGAAWRGTIGGFGGIGGQASTAAQGAADAATHVAKGAADVAKGAADIATSAAKETAGAVTRLPTAQIASGRERCTIAPNGAPDCQAAASALCKAKGFSSGSSIDFENVENCPAQVLVAGRQHVQGECPIDYFVTKSLCQ
jgi:hypothetical protein